MNKIILMGRLTRDPEVRYSNAAEPIAVARYTLAVDRRSRPREGEPTADFINCVAFGRTGEFAEKYFKKGQMVAVSGRLQISTVDDNTGQRRWFTDVIVEDQHFAESRASFESRSNSNPSGAAFNPNLNPPERYQNQQNNPQSNNNLRTSSPNSEDSFFEVEHNISDEDLPF